MKTIALLFLVNLPLISLAQNELLENLWYVESSFVTNLKKATITLVLDSVSKTTGERICTEVYNFQKDSCYYTTRWCKPVQPVNDFSVGGASSVAGHWYLTVEDFLILTQTFNEKVIKREFGVQWISARKIILVENDRLILPKTDRDALLTLANFNFVPNYSLTFRYQIFGKIAPRIAVNRTKNEYSSGESEPFGGESENLP